MPFVGIASQTDIKWSEWTKDNKNPLVPYSTVNKEKTLEFIRYLSLFGYRFPPFKGKVTPKHFQQVAGMIRDTDEEYGGSFGIDSSSSITITGGSVTAESGKTHQEQSVSYGIACGDLKISGENTVVKATGGTAGSTTSTYYGIARSYDKKY